MNSYNRMNSLFGFGGLLNTGLSAASYSSGRSYKNNNNNNNVPAPAAAPASTGFMPKLNQYRSKAARLLTRKKKVNKPKNNIYVPSNTEAPAVNLSYVGNRNASVRNNFNAMVVGSTSNKPLTNKQKAARTAVARKMAMGQPVTYQEKVNAGMIAFPKPTMPKPVGYIPKPTGPRPNRPAAIPRPAVGGKKTRRNRKH